MGCCVARYTYICSYGAIQDAWSCNHPQHHHGHALITLGRNFLAPSHAPETSHTAQRFWLPRAEFEHFGSCEKAWRTSAHVQCPRAWR